jgi:hypothetical protein
MTNKNYYQVKKNGMYINYISLLTDDPFKLPDSSVRRTMMGQVCKKPQHILYTEKELEILLKLEKNVSIEVITR